MLEWLLAALIILITWLVWIYILNPYRLVQYYAKQGFTPYFYPYKGNLHFMQHDLKNFKNIYAMHQNFAREHPNSKGIVVNVKDYVIVTIFDLKMKKAYYLNNEKYIKRDSGVTLMLKEVIGDRNILVTEGDEWKSRRKLISKAFTFDFVKSLGPFIVLTTNVVFDETYSKKKNNEVNIMGMFQEITGRTFVNSFFGQDMSGIEFEGQTMTAALNDLLFQYIPLGFQTFSFVFGGKCNRRFRHTKFRRNLHLKKLRFKKEIGKLIKNKHELYLKGELPKNNLLHIFFQENPNLSEPYFTDLIHEYIMLYVAGTDTTGHLLTHMLLMMLKNPETKDKILEEIEKTPNLDDEHYAWETVQKMTYLYAFMKETLRLKPSVADTAQRLVIKDFMLGDVHVKKGTVLLNGYLSSCYDPRFFENPDKFIPERWMEGGKNYKTEDEEPFLFIPFSAGNRNCIGQHLAKFEALVIFIKFLKRFDFEWANKEKYDEQWVQRFLYETKDPLKIKLKEKK